MTHTESTYPYKPYPPFEDPRDWRDLVGGVSEHVQTKARQLVDGASWDHDERHGAHDHPWCRHCLIRFYNTDRAKTDLPPLLAPWELGRRLVTEFGYGEDHEDVQAMKRLYEGGYAYTLDAARQGFPDMDEPRLAALHSFVSDLDEWEAIDEQAKREPLSRACRYLVAFGKQPADPWPFDDGLDLEAEYLSRDELDDLPQPEPLIDGILPRHSYGILRGRDHSLKTFAALDWSLCLATGTPWQGRTVEPVKVLYIAGEGAHGIGKRVDAWEEARGVKVLDTNFITRKSALNMFKPGAAFDHLLDVIEENQFGLVVIDTLRRVSGSADGNGSEMGAVVDNVDRIKRATDEGSVLVISHTDKGDNDSRGYSGIEDDADVVWHAKRDEMRLDLHNTKMKDGPDDFHVYLQARKAADSLVLEEAGDFIEVANESQIKLLDLLRTVFADGASGPQLRDASELPKPTFYRVLSALVEAGHVLKTGTKQRPFYELIKSQQSPEVSGSDRPSDLHSLTESQSVLVRSGGVSPVSRALGVRHETTDATRPQDNEVA